MLKTKRDPGDRGIYRRHVTAPDLVRFEVRVGESDLLCCAEADLSAKVRELLQTHRDRLVRYLRGHEGFATALRPVPIAAAAPSIVRRMGEAAAAAGVGPMAAVAGAVSEEVALGLAGLTGELVIENGGDVYLRSRRERTVGIYTGEPGQELAFGVHLRPADTPLGICTSSGRIGHSRSFGTASAATILAATPSLADAAATATANAVRGEDGIRQGLRVAAGIAGVGGAVIVRDGKIGAWGSVELVRL